MITKHFVKKELVIKTYLKDSSLISEPYVCFMNIRHMHIDQNTYMYD